MSLQPSVVAVDGNVASENILFSTLQENQEIVNVECQQQSKQHCRQNIKSPSPISLSPQQQQQQQQQHSSSSSSLLSTSKSFCLMPENHFFDVNVKVEYIDFPSKNSIQKNCFVTKSNVENGKNVQMTNNFLDTDVQQRQQQQKMDKQRSNSVNDVCGICIKQQQQQSTDETTMAIPVSNKSSTKSLNLVKTTKNDHRKRKTIINNDHHQPQRKLSKSVTNSTTTTTTTTTTTGKTIKTTTTTEIIVKCLKIVYRLNHRKQFPQR
nr:kinase and exchange factor for Rac A-like [Dermatophagoides farinae]